MRWSTNKPWKEGFYWYRENDIDDVVRVYQGTSPKELLASGSMHGRRLVHTMDGEWAGPLESPEKGRNGMFSQ